MENQKKQMRSKDDIIVYQNQSHLVQEWFKSCGICPDLLDISLATDLLVQFCLYGFSKELQTRFENMDKYLAEKYKG